MFSVAPTAVTLVASPTASAGIVQFPFVPRAATVLVSVAPNEANGPTRLGNARVSINRQGVIGTNVVSLSPGAASARHAWKTKTVTSATASPVANTTRLRSEIVTGIGGGSSL